MRFDIVKFLRGLKTLGLRTTRREILQERREFIQRCWGMLDSTIMETHQERQRKAENKVTKNRQLKLIRMIYESKKVSGDTVSVINPATMATILIAVVNALREHEIQLDELKDPSMKTRETLRLQIARGTGEEAMAAFEELMRRRLGGYSKAYLDP